ncbi:hypothetical protein ADINL_0480 [Nitrincola lacisaponensis]|uniref:Serine aminopeptidase S33 domain-containing protein n=1 Tax=Nitrincola lacisaponensis TaxID=267850 RepID=A0A063Y7U7_9GAMM|nr:alpha/beta fold hydrolase [Nitrincola lacisaponensis]KDE40831.1 hypothetical protein ADINL_0480 [Nitrincola lacisaponensis]
MLFLRSHLWWVLLLSIACGDALASADYFQHGDQKLVAYFLTPEDHQQTKGVIIFVHGDGAMPYDAHGYYQPIWQRLSRAGFAIFSWNKPGVGGSSGQWLLQSMEDRQSEVLAAIEHVKARYGFQAGQIGIVGFSQAGWVVPKIAKNNQDVCFLIGAGFALNWMEQSWYLTNTRMQLQGSSSAEVDSAYQRYLDEQVFFSQSPNYHDYLSRFGDKRSAISRERFQFIALNHQADATTDYTAITQPFLLLLGEQDRNVDIKTTYETLQHITAQQNNIQIQIVADATHGLLKHPQFNTQTPGFWWWLRFTLSGEKAFADGVLDQIEHWSINASKQCKPHIQPSSIPRSTARTRSRTPSLERILET